MQRKKLKRNKELVTIKELPDKFIISLLFVVTAIGFYLRLANVGSISLWVDEYVHVLRAKDFVNGIGPLFTNDNNGILYTIFIVPLFYLFESSATWARFPSVLFGTGSIYLVYLVAKNIFNKNIGLIASFILTFSLYNVYWSRISRNYAIFMFFYLLVLLFFIKGFEKDEKVDSAKVLERNGISLKYLGLFLGAFLFSLLSHQLTFLFVFGVAVYFIGGEMNSLFNRNVHNIKNKYFVLSIVSIFGLSLIFLPFAAPFIKGILAYFLPDRIVTWVIPDWALLSKYYEETPFKTFNIYYAVIKNDYPLFYWLGVAGIPLSFFINRKGGIFLMSMFVVPFVLMSFVFKDPSLPRYLIFIYPLFIISAASFLYLVGNLVYEKLFTSGNTIAYHGFTWVLPIVAILFFIPSEELETLSKAENKQGYIIDKSLSNWSFTNWKYSSRYVKANMKDGDLVLSTVTPASIYYIDVDSCIHFRQRYYDTTEKKYKNNEPKQCSAPCAKSYEDLRDILMNYDRGWLLADYYFYNVMTDPRARALVCKYMDYHPQGTRDGGVLVFSWNKKNPKPVKNQSMLYVLGKSDVKQRTNELNVTMKPGIDKLKNFILNSYARSVSKNEMYVLINKKHKVAFPPTKTNDQIEQLSIKLKSGILKEGRNTFSFFYNKNVKNDAVKGFSLHHFIINAR